MADRLGEQAAQVAVGVVRPALVVDVEVVDGRHALAEVEVLQELVPGVIRHGHRSQRKVTGDGVGDDAGGVGDVETQVALRRSIGDRQTQEARRLRSDGERVPGGGDGEQCGLISQHGVAVGRARQGQRECRACRGLDAVGGLLGRIDPDRQRRCERVDFRDGDRGCVGENRVVGDGGRPRREDRPGQRSGGGSRVDLKPERPGPVGDVVVEDSHRHLRGGLAGGEHQRPRHRCVVESGDGRVSGAGSRGAVAHAHGVGVRGAERDGEHRALRIAVAALADRDVADADHRQSRDAGEQRASHQQQRPGQHVAERAGQARQPVADAVDELNGADGPGVDCVGDGRDRRDRRGHRRRRIRGDRGCCRGDCNRCGVGVGGDDDRVVGVRGFGVRGFGVRCRCRGQYNRQRRRLPSALCALRAGCGGGPRRPGGSVLPRRRFGARRTGPGCVGARTRRGGGVRVIGGVGQCQARRPAQPQAQNHCRRTRVLTALGHLHHPCRCKP